MTALEHWLGETYTQLGNVAEAERMLNRAVQKRGLLMKDAQDDAAMREYCRSQLKLGDFYLIHQGDVTKALKHYLPAWTGYDRLLKADPASRTARQDMANIEYRIAALLAAAEKAGVELEEVPGAGEAGAHFERSCELREQLAKIDPDDMQAKIEWAIVLARCGRAAEARQQAEILFEKGEHDPRLLFQAACTFAFCTLTDDQQLATLCRDRALDVLEGLTDSGWKDQVVLPKTPISIPSEATRASSS